MKSSQAKALLAFGLMLLSAACAAWLRPTQHLTEHKPKVDLERIFPTKFSDWRQEQSGPVLLVSPDQQEWLTKIYSQTLTRTYVNGVGARIMLSVAYGGDQSDATRAHRPDVCYPAQGFSVRENRDVTLVIDDTRLPVRRMVAQQSHRVEPLTYWIMVGTLPARSGTEQKLAQLRYGIHGLIPDGMLVRVSSIDDNPNRGMQLQTDFLTKLYLSADESTRTTIFGKKLPAL